MWDGYNYDEILKAAKSLQIGQRVCHTTEGVGIVRDINLSYPPTVDVQWLTPDNEPSVLTSCVFEVTELTVVGENVLPQPRSKEWKKQSKELCDALESILKHEGF